MSTSDALTPDARSLYGLQSNWFQLLNCERIGNSRSVTGMIGFCFISFSTYGGTQDRVVLIKEFHTNLVGLW
jgi:hypothetical protein